ncbi:MAG: tyrosine-protein phosphatase [Limnohabitans sp.]|nr:tyrosine-protein phosphatase [Limnohabitans sp.]
MVEMNKTVNTLPELHLQGAPNFRDLCGYANRHGKTLKPSLIYRSDHLGQLTAGDIKHLQSLHNRSWLVLDFRGKEERLTQPCTLPDAKVLSLSIEPTVVQTLTNLLNSGVAVSSQKTVELMQDTYSNFIRQHSHRFCEFFNAIFAHPESTVVFHCTAGKDRTGMAATLLLHALDVPMDTIWHDYMLTNERLRHMPYFATAPEVARVLQTVQADFLQAALDTVAQDHGHLDVYLLNALGVDKHKRQSLAARFLA